MSDQISELAAKVDELLKSRTVEAPTAPAMGQVAAPGQAATAAGPLGPMMASSTMMGAHTMMPAQQMATSLPAATGISFRIAIPFPDGSEVPAYIHFGPELLQNPNMLHLYAESGRYPNGSVQPCEWRVYAT